MLSDQKLLLRGSEAIAMLATVALLVQAARTSLAPPAGYPAFLAATVCFLTLLLTFLPACLLASEYLRTTRPPRPPGDEADGLSAADMAYLTRWSPRRYKAAAWLALPILLGTLFTFGDVTITTRSQLEPGKVPALFLYFSVFHLVCLPVLASAARMPGSYAANQDT